MESHLEAWAQQMAELVRRKTRERDQRHQTAVLNQVQAERLWVAGMDEVVHTLTRLVQALRQTDQFPQLTLLTHARSPQGTTTYMRRGALLTLKGVGQDHQTIEFAIDARPAFRPDLLTPVVRVHTIQEARHGATPLQAQVSLGVTVQGIVVWQILNPALPLPTEGSVEDLLTSLLAACFEAE
ncbi:MAG TPA: hypothetical protein VNN62_06445 [Methylomirabilota bacterium]|jgi:hypothetical protein|nr:hypothetical protein [Methylomirabilota bacterium]